MKEKTKMVLMKICKIVYLIYNFNSKVKIYNFRNLLFSYWLRNSFKSCGKRIRVHSPVFIKGNKYISIGEGFNSLERLRLECWDEYEGVQFSPELLIGNNVVMNFNVHIGCIDKVTIGDNVLFGSNVLITDHQHGYLDQRDVEKAPAKRVLSTRGPVIIENNVWIGENVAIMPNVTIGEGCVIGANSVVTKSFPRYSVLVGVPAKCIKTIKVDL